MIQLAHQLRISSSDAIPIYTQIVRQLKHLISTGRLVAGDELPGIRVLAAGLLVNPNTVARAYMELENEGLLIKRPGTGTYVSDQGSPLAHKERLKILNEKIESLVVEARQLEFDADSVQSLLWEKFRALEKQNRSKPSSFERVKKP